MRSTDRCYAILFIVLLAFGTLTACARTGASSSSPVDLAAEWPMEGYGPARNRGVDEALSIPLSTLDEYPLADSVAHASPVAIAQGLIFADSDRKLHALAVGSGDEQWQINLAGSFLSPAVAAGTVFVRVESGADGSVVALKADSGAKLWQYKFARVGSAYDNVGGHVTSPVVVDGVVLVGAAEQVYALDAADGAVIWNYETEYPVVSSVSVADATVFVSDFTRLYALDLQSGRERWRFDHGKLSLYFAPIVIGDQVAIASYDTIYLLDRTNGAPVWSKQFDEMQVIPAGAAQQQLYVKSTNQLWALNRSDGVVLWNYATQNFVSLPAITSDQLYIITRSDGGSQLRALRPSDGQEVWRQDHAGLINAAPVVAGGRVYVRTDSGGILVFASS